jgi:chemotaxis protein methyltransferase CheR
MITLTDREFDDITGYIRSIYGINLEKKRPLIEGRLGFYIHSLGYDNYTDYFEFVKNDPTRRELENLVNRLTTNHTYFMREEEHFEFLEKTVLPWVSDTLRDHDLRLWSAGCSTGQEPYTISMVTIDYFAARTGVSNTVILGSDISERALSVAREGVYTEEELIHLPDKWRSKYFLKLSDDSWKVLPVLRNNVEYKYINLLDPFQVKKPFHTIFCRNVMIYFDNPTKELIINKMYDAMMPGGYLFIGHSESLSALEHRFEYVSPSIYRKSMS